MTFCQSAGNHATVAAGSAVAATEIDSNKCRERKRKGGGRGREEGPKGRKKRKRKGEKGRVEKDSRSRVHVMSGDEPGLDVDCQRRYKITFISSAGVSLIL